MILAVAGGKGGTGRSTVAFNLAAELDAVVVDADLGMADLPASHGPDLHDVLAGRADACEAVREDGPVRILPCGRTIAGARACEPTRLVAALEAVAATYGDVVVDCPGGGGADAAIPLVAADACLVVTTPTAASLENAFRTRELARVLDAGLLRVVLNLVDGMDGEGGAADENPPTGALSRAFGAPVVVVPSDERLAVAQAAGLPVRVVAPETPSLRAFEELAAAAQSLSFE